MKIFPLILFIVSFLNCPLRNENNHLMKKPLHLPELGVIDARYPFRLMDVDLSNSNNMIQMNDGIESELRKTIYSYYFNECPGDSTESLIKVKDIYIGTIRIHETLQTLYLILLHHMPGGEVNSKILFYDNTAKTFANTTFDFNLHALYDYENGKLKASNLKNGLNFNLNEIELEDIDKDGANDFKFTRLLHNGTANAIETIVLKTVNSKIDTLELKTEWIVNNPKILQH